jgi:hypothetical protein
MLAAVATRTYIVVDDDEQVIHVTPGVRILSVITIHSNQITNNSRHHFQSASTQLQGVLHDPS